MAGIFSSSSLAISSLSFVWVKHDLRLYWRGVWGEELLTIRAAQEEEEDCERFVVWVGWDIPLFWVKLLIFLDFVMDGAGVIVGDILVDDLESVGWEELLYISQRVLRWGLLHHKQIYSNTQILSKKHKAHVPLIRSTHHSSRYISFRSTTTRIALSWRRYYTSPTRLRFPPFVVNDLLLHHSCQLGK